MPAEHDSLPKTLSLIGHELSTPLSIALGYLRMLVREQAGPLNDRQRKMLEEVDRSCARIASLLEETKQLRRFLAGELPLKREPFDLAALVAELASDMHETRDHGTVTVEVRGADQPLEVVGDRRHLGDAMKALLRAALRERGEPGVVVAELRRVGTPPSAVLLIGSDEVSNELATVTDTPYDEWQGGTGMARPMARRVIEAHGGSVWAAPGERPRAGTGIRIPLPA
jgi:signal transduction histidine kinase